MTLPINFLYLGGDKCGSTWVYHILSQHPDVALPRAKELFYFDRFYDKGAEWYAKQFPERKATRIGEICHDYLYCEDALVRIAQDMPQASRFLITVRAPVERTLSHYKYLRKIGRTRAPVDRALKEQPQIIEHSMFGKHVARAQAILGPDRVHVLSFEDLKADPDAFGARMCAALGIRYLPDLPYRDKILAAQSARYPGLVALLRNMGWGLRALGLPGAVSRVKSSAVVNRALYSARQDAPGNDLNADLMRHLTHVFEADQQLLRDRVPTLLGAHQ